jgi:indolepyruvate ferredoxin oxidoreductase beta subunit
MKLDVVICGVGGQGNLLASVAIAQYAINKGYNVFGTETIGAAQRGGSVVSHLRISDQTIYSPLVPQASADVLVGFEPIEALRNIKLVNSHSRYIINMEPVPTVLCNMGLDHYPAPERIIEVFQERCKEGYVFNATAKARALGNALMTNVVILGALARISSFFDKGEFSRTLTSLLPPKIQDINLQAFEVGFALVDEGHSNIA